MCPARFTVLWNVLVATFGTTVHTNLVAPSELVRHLISSDASGERDIQHKTVQLGLPIQHVPNNVLRRFPVTPPCVYPKNCHVCSNGKGRHRSQAIDARNGPIQLLNLVVQQFARVKSRSTLRNTSADRENKRRFRSFEESVRGTKSRPS